MKRCSADQDDGHPIRFLIMKYETGLSYSSLYLSLTSILQTGFLHIRLVLKENFFYIYHSGTTWALKARVM